jgi:hypothetical protein
MATSAGEALPIRIVNPAQDWASDRTGLAQGHSIAKPHGPASGKELVTAIEEKHEESNACEAQGSQRWRALDKLLRTSFGTISPAYLFNSFLDIR